MVGMAAPSTSSSSTLTIEKSASDCGSSSNNTCAGRPVAAERAGDVLAVHQDVEQDVAVVRHARQPSRRGVLALVVVLPSALAGCGAVEDRPGAASSPTRTDVPDELRDVLGRVQNDLFDVGADFCTPVVEDPEYLAHGFPPEATDFSSATPAISMSLRCRLRGSPSSRASASS